MAIKNGNYGPYFIGLRRGLDNNERGAGFREVVVKILRPEKENKALSSDMLNLAK